MVCPITWGDHNYLTGCLLEQVENENLEWQPTDQVHLRTAIRLVCVCVCVYVCVCMCVCVCV